MDPNGAASPTKFATIALLDLETCNLPAHNYNRTSITELCIYGFAATVLETSCVRALASDGKESLPPSVPASPRVLHKLTLLLNPRMMVHPEAENITGLSNDILENESYFDDNAADTVLGFLLHLQQPVCLVAHNGWGFDFPIVKETFDKLQKQLPANMVCVDSLRAFLEIDRKGAALQLLPEQNVATSTTVALQETRKELLPMLDVTIATPVALQEPTEEDTSELLSLEDALNDNSQFNWRQLNESTPTRVPLPKGSANIKRKLLAESSPQSNNLHNVTPIERTLSSPSKKHVSFKSQRSLFFGADASPVFKKYPPRGVYRLEPMYKRIFKESLSMPAHHAEADVVMLLKLLLHYGTDFITYAEQHAQPFAKIPKLGTY